MEGVQAKIECSCGNEAWIGVGEITPPCDLCGNVYYGEAQKTKTGCTKIVAKLLQDDIKEITKEKWWKTILLRLRVKLWKRKL